MPFFLGTPKVDNNQLFFHWDEAYDIGGEDITYDFMISTNLDFKKIVAESKLTNGNNFQMLMLKPGSYYWRVTAENTSGMTQTPFDFYVDANSVNHYGVKYFSITSDGQVLEK
jgi:spore coat protein H